MVRAAIGIGSNLNDPERNVRRAISALSRFGKVTAQSRLYRSKPWGVADQPDFCNAAALLDTDLSPEELLRALQALEAELGRVPGERWGPRAIDLDILLYGDLALDMPGLEIPHPRLRERAFVLAPLSEVDDRFVPALQALDPSERAGVFPLEGGETVALMSDEDLIERVRTLTQAFLETDLVRLRIEDANEDAVELRKPHSAPERRISAAEAGPPAAPATPPDPIKADLVGIFHFSRPAVSEGDRLDGDREIGHVEALGIRNPVRSLGGGRIAGVLCADGQPVEYGQVLFEIDRV